MWLAATNGFSDGEVGVLVKRQRRSGQLTAMEMAIEKFYRQCRSYKTVLRPMQAVISATSSRDFAPFAPHSRRRPGPPQIAEEVARARLSGFQPVLLRQKPGRGTAGFLEDRLKAQAAVRQAAHITQQSAARACNTGLCL